MTRLLITGATGNVGSRLVPILQHLGCYEVYLVVRDMEKAQRMFGEVSGVSFVLEQEMYNSAPDINPDIIVHLATFATVASDRESADKLIDSNLRFGTHLLNAFPKIRYFVNVGTFAEYRMNDGNIDNAYLYSVTKTAFRLFIDYYSRLNGFNSVHVIPYSIYGNPGGTRKTAVDIIVDSLDAMLPQAMSGGWQALDFIYIDDVCDFFSALLPALEHGKVKHGTVIPLGTGSATSLRELAILAEKVSGKRANIEWDALPYRPRDVMHAQADTSVAERLLNWQTKISLEEGVRRYLQEVSSIL